MKPVTRDFAVKTEKTEPGPPRRQTGHLGLSDRYHGPAAMKRSPFLTLAMTLPSSSLTLVYPSGSLISAMDARGAVYSASASASGGLLPTVVSTLPAALKLVSSLPLAS